MLLFLVHIREKEKADDREMASERSDQNTAKYRVLHKVSEFRWNISIPRTRAVHRGRN